VFDKLYSFRFFRSTNPTWKCSGIAHSGIDTTLVLSALVSYVFLQSWALKVRYKYGLLRLGYFNERRTSVGYLPLRHREPDLEIGFCQRGMFFPYYELHAFVV
jgi:hypothetical protein